MPTEIEWAKHFEKYAKEIDVDKDIDAVLRTTVVHYCQVIRRDLLGCASYKLGWRLAKSTPNIHGSPQGVDLPYVLSEVQRGWRDAKTMMGMMV